MKLVYTYLFALAILMMSITDMHASQASPNQPSGRNDSNEYSGTNTVNHQEFYDSDSDTEDDKETVRTEKEPIYEDADAEFIRLFVTGDRKKTDLSKQTPTRIITVATETKSESKAAKEPRTLDTLVQAKDLTHLNLNANNEFKHGETVAIIRSSGDLKYAKIFAPEQVNQTWAEYKIPAKGYLNVTCFLLSERENYRQYPICSIFKIDSETKEPAVCQLCKQSFTQLNNRLYPCGHMFHLTCIGNYKAEAHTLLTPGCPFCGSPCNRPECSAHPAH